MKEVLLTPEEVNALLDCSENETHAMQQLEKEKRRHKKAARVKDKYDSRYGYSNHTGTSRRGTTETQR